MKSLYHKKKKIILDCPNHEGKLKKKSRTEEEGGEGNTYATDSGPNNYIRKQSICV